MSVQKKNKKLLLKAVGSVFKVAQNLKLLELESLVVAVASKVMVEKVYSHQGEAVALLHKELEKRGLEVPGNANLMSFALELSIRVLRDYSQKSGS